MGAGSAIFFTCVDLKDEYATYVETVATCDAVADATCVEVPVIDPKAPLVLPDPNVPDLCKYIIFALS